MRILITGGAGFIGSHLTGLLSSETVTILDDLSAGRLENIPDDANFVCCDVKSPLARDVVKNGHFDAIVHLAAQTMVPASMEDPKKDMEDNIEGTVNILEAARKYGVKRIIFFFFGRRLRRYCSGVPSCEGNGAAPPGIFLRTV